MNKITAIGVILFLFGCAPQVKQQEPIVLKKGEPIPLGDQFWTLDFTYFYKGKESKPLSVNMTIAAIVLRRCLRCKRRPAKCLMVAGQVYVKSYLSTDKSEPIRIA
ncbi:MAG: hypothetical protein EBQ50_00725 [Burkholderiaceae bacterium]|nr:hypothetical protein [Burkholderiaceae bacterium]